MAFSYQLGESGGNPRHHLDYQALEISGKRPEKRHMSGFQDFAKILEDRIRKEIEAEVFMDSSSPDFDAKDESFSQRDELPLGFAWILGQQGNLSLHSQDKVTETRARQAYGVKAKALPPHALNLAQAQAKNLFNNLGAQLAPAFRKMDLKKAWRQVAKATHPDQGGTASAFREAQAAYQTLQTVFAV